MERLSTSSSCVPVMAFLINFLLFLSNKFHEKVFWSDVAMQTTHKKKDLDEMEK
jgi:hypothetical protein